MQPEQLDPLGPGHCTLVPIGKEADAMVEIEKTRITNTPRRLMTFTFVFMEIPSFLNPWFHFPDLGDFNFLD
jgi:hypothetical protein